MKKIIFLSTLFMALFSMSSFAVADADGHCKWECYFKYPTKKNYNYGEKVKVRVEPKYGYGDITYCKLYVDGHFVRKESKYPYEWYNDHALKSLKPGKHRIECRIYTRCGFYKTIDRWIYVGEGHDGGGHEETCHFNSPFDLGWCGKYKQGYKVCVYKDGHKKYIRVYHCHSRKIKWFDCYGNIICYNDNHHIPRKCFKVKCYDYCDYTGGGNDDNHKCQYDGKIYCKTQYKHHWGYYLYVEFKPYKKYDIKYVDLYLGNKKLKRESSYPFDWSPSKGVYGLKGLKKGHKYQLKCRVYTKCGHSHWVTKWITIGHAS